MKIRFDKKVQLIPVIILCLAASSGLALGASQTVLIQGFSFNPPSTTVNVGDTVTWIQKDSIGHTTTSDASPPVWNSPLLSLNQTFSFTFSAPGSYPYHCTPHPFMTGTITVAQAGNQPPTVQLTSPADGSVFATTDSVALTATASDPDGTVTQVEYFDGGASLGIAAVAPYNVTVNNLAAGSHQLTAVATDNQGATSTSAPITIQVNAPPANLPPAVQITGPTEGSVFTAPASFTITCVASDTDGTVSQVEYLDNGSSLGIANTSPFNLAVNGLAAGTHQLTAIATDNQGASTASTPVNIQVNVPPINVPPTVQITSPTNGTALTAPTDLTLTASASDSDGTVSQVEFLEGTSSLGIATIAPFSVTIKNVTDGVHQYIAQATDNQGATTNSAPITIVVNTPSSTNQTVLINKFAFFPKNLDIQVGDTVTWVQKDTTQHTTTSGATPPLWNSGLLSLNQTFSFQFNAAGAYPYFCIPHQTNPNMHGTITVQPPLQFGSVSNQDLAIRIDWTGGTGLYLLQRKASLADSNWVDVLTTTNRTATVPKAGSSSFFRVMDNATSPVIPFTVLLTASNEVPATASSATGVGLLSLSGSNLAYQVGYTGLTGGATAAHIHGPADATVSAGVLFPLSGAAGTEGLLSGSQANLTADQITALVAGQTYVNIHTPANNGGEIRGQIVPLRIPIKMDGASEVPAVVTPATATGWITLIGNQMSWEINYSGLTADATAAHVHGAADTTHSTGVLFPMPGAAGTAGTLSGSHTLSQTELTNVLAGLTYMNIHTGNNPSGEIRGQIWPWQFTVSLNGAKEVPATTASGTGTGTFYLAGSSLSYNITYSGLTGDATAAHVHGPADTAHSTGVLFPLAGASGPAGTLSGVQTLTAEELVDIITGNAYANIHTAANPSGEIRGQLTRAD